MADNAQELENKYHFQMYGRYPITMEKGKGVRVTDTNGKEYIDALAGIAVNALGHSHPKVVKAIQDQAENLIHISNLYYSKPQSELAELITKASGMDRVFFCNSGGEAVEGSIKLARKFGHNKGKTGNIISMKNCFHGRTIATIALGKEKYYKGFEPLPGGYDNVPFNNLDALKDKMNEDTIGVILEPIQGEGGIHVADHSFMKGVRELCDQYDALMILDEIQCGVARTGSMYAYQQYGIEPDIVASAKALGGGFPIGAVLAKEEVSKAFTPGTHGTTYGGNPLACAASKAALQTIIDENLAEQATEKGNYFVDKVRDIAKDWDAIREVRGLGLMIGVDLAFKGSKVVEHMMDKGVLANCTSDTVIRLVPPLIISKEELDTVFDVLVESIKEIEKDHE